MEEKQKIRLTDNFIKQLINTPENGMGFHNVDLHLKNGEILKNIIVINCSILTLEKTLKLDIDDIEKIAISKV
jgi:hypothetical protein